MLAERFIEILVCSSSANKKLDIEGDKVICQQYQKYYLIKDGISTILIDRVKNLPIIMKVRDEKRHR